jgi:hypothetical protein
MKFLRFGTSLCPETFKVIEFEIWTDGIYSFVRKEPIQLNLC